jgi:hypothetical protein
MHYPDDSGCAGHQIESLQRIAPDGRGFPDGNRPENPLTVPAGRCPGAAMRYK